jgi:lysozyme family protein
MKRKVRIKSLPKGYHMMPNGTVMKDSAHMAEGGSVNKNLSPIPRGMANLEAEKGEVAMTDLGKTGQMGLYEIGGERHSNGGTPLNLDPGSFIYSDTRKMKIKDPQFLAKYGKSTPTTPAKLVKPFLKMNDFTNTLYDQNADPIQKRTAQTMIDNYKDKAGEIAFYQEAMKGFPQGIPAVAANYAEGVMGAPMAAYGGYIPKAQAGLNVSSFLPSSYIKNIIDFEGGLSKDPRDNAAKTGKTSDGYHTNRGITYATYKDLARKVLGINPSEKHFKSLKPEEAVKFVEHYGTSKGLDKLQDPALASLLHSFNWGSGNAMDKKTERVIEKTLGVDISFVNGKLTDESVDKLNNAESSLRNQLFDNLIAERKDFYKNLDDYSVYGKGWNRRLDSLKNLKNEGFLNDLETQRLLPEAMQLPPGYVRMPNRSSPTSGDEMINMPYFPLPGFVSGLDNDVMDIYLQIDPTQRAARRDMGQTQFFRPSQSAERFIPQTRLQMPVDVANNPNNINYAIQSDVDLSMINPYTGGRTEAGRITPTGIENRFERSLPDYVDSWKKFIPGIANMSNKQAQSAIYDYLVENEPDAVRNMWGTYGLTAKGKQNKSLSSKYDKGTIDPKNLSEEDLKGLKDAYVDGLFGVRQMDPVNYGFLETPVNLPLSEEEETEISDSTQATEATQATQATEATQAKTVEDRLRPWLQDVNNLNTARRNMLSERRYFPYAPKIPNTLADAVYLDDTRQQQQIAGRSRGVIEALGAFSGPSRQASMASVISGQAGDQAANVAATMGNANAQIANQLEQFNSQMQLRGNMLNAELAKNLFDETTTTLDTYDEKMRRYRSLNTLLENNLLTNAYRTKAMNKMNPLFQIDPSVGGDFEFMPGVSAAMFDPNNFVGQSQRFDAAYNSAAERIKTGGYSPQQQTELLKKLEEKRLDAMFGSSSKNSAPAYDPTGYIYPAGSNMQGAS